MSMQAVVFHGPFDVRVETRPKPQVRDETDAILKVLTAGLCGSELHMYRGHQKTNTGKQNLPFSISILIYSDLTLHVVAC